MNRILRRIAGMTRLRLIIVPLALVVGIATISLALANHETKQNMRHIYTKGNYLVSLIATHPISSLGNERREIVMKTLAKFTYPQGVAYCIIHDDADR